MRTVLAIGLAAGLALTLAAQEQIPKPPDSLATMRADATYTSEPQAKPKALTELQQAKARIVQLESQLAKLSADHAVCQARVALAGQQQQDEHTKAAMAAIEKEAGCPIDWTLALPTCRPAPPAR